MATTLPPLLLAGNFLSSLGGSRGPIEDLADRLQGLGAQVVCSSRVRTGWVRGLDLLSTALLRRREYRVGVVDLYSGNAFLWGEALSILLTALRCPFVIVLHGGGLPEFARQHPERVRACLRRARAVTAPSRFLMDAMRPYRADIELIPNPVELSACPFSLRDPARPKLVWVRAFHRMYNPALAVHALALLDSEYSEISLTMVGPDKGDGSLEETREAARSLGVLDKIEFVGGVARSDVPRWLERGDIFLNTTDVDNTPVSVIEALACGLCVVSTDAGGVPRLVANGTDALLVPRNDPHAMAQAVRRILTEPGLAQSLSHRGRRTAEGFDWSRVLPRWEGLLAGMATH